MAKLTKMIVEETGDHAASLLGLIERRAPNISASESANFILEKWRAGGVDRDRLIAHAMKDEPTIRVERELSKAIHVLLKPLAGKPYSVKVTTDVRTALVRFLRGRLPKAKISSLVEAANSAIDYRDDRLVIRMDALVALFVPHKLVS